MGKRFLFVAAALVAMVSTASAQTRFFGGDVINGSLVVELDNAPGGNTWTFDLAGMTFHLVGVGEAGGLVQSGCMADPECKPGVVMDLSAFLFVQGGARAVVNGETLESAFISVGGTGPQIQTSTVTIPKGNRKHLVLSAPFTVVAAGPIDVFRNVNEWNGGAEPWARGMITGGGGTATAFFERYHVKDKDIGFYYELRRIIYSFNAPSSAQ
jgi:hypothetical protein